MTAGTGLPVSRSNAVFAASRIFLLNAEIGFTSDCFRGRPRFGLAHCSASGNSNCGRAWNAFKKLNGFTWSGYSRPRIEGFKPFQ